MARTQPAQIDEIRQALASIRENYPPPWPSRAEAQQKECEREYGRLAREAVAPALEKSARLRRDGDEKGALLALWEAPAQWLLDTTGGRSRDSGASR